MRSLLMSILLASLPYIAVAQNDFWVFSHNCGIVFNSNGIVSTGYSNPYYIFEACISVSDSNNNLLFYSDGINIYNNQNAVMDQGWAIRSNVSTSQGITYLALDSDYYFFFALDAVSSSSMGGLTWGLIDMNQNSGLGKVIKKNQFLADSLSEAQAILSSNNEFFLIAKSAYNDYFKVFKIDPKNKSISLHKRIPFNSFPYYNPQSFIKISPNAQILTCTNVELKDVELFCIKNNPIDIKYFGAINGFSQKIENVYGCEYSPDNSKLYFTTLNYLFQADLSSLNIENIKKSVSELYGPLNLTLNTFTCPQLGPDKKIYIKEGYNGNISTINAPNLSGTNCQFQFNGLNISNCDYNGNLPYFQTYSLNEDTLFQMTLPCKDPEDSGYFEMPNVFTPNGDGINDTLMAFTKNTRDFTFYLYNRWGELVFESHTPEFKWDGYSNGQPCSTGAYYALLHYTLNRKEVSSNKIIQLIR